MGARPAANSFSQVRSEMSKRSEAMDGSHRPAAPRIDPIFQRYLPRQPAQAKRTSKTSEAIAITSPAISYPESGSRKTATPMAVSKRIIETE
jgi:hypothetical protein